MTKQHITYREGTIHDVDQLFELGKLAYEQYQHDLTPDNWSIFNNNLQDRQNCIDVFNISKCIVCLDGDQIIGVAYFIPSGNPTNLFRSDWSYIRKVGVHPNYRGMGIAKNLTLRCIDIAKLTNEKTIALHTSEFMDAARHIYESLGFKILKEIPPLFGKKYWLYTLDIN